MKSLDDLYLYNHIKPFIFKFCDYFFDDNKDSFETCILDILHSISILSSFLFLFFEFPNIMKNEDRSQESVKLNYILMFIFKTKLIEEWY